MVDNNYPLMYLHNVSMFIKLHTKLTNPLTHFWSKYDPGPSAVKYSNHD